MAGGVALCVAGKSTKSKPLSVHRYTPRLKHEWDNFIQRACNSTFLFQRDYMDYHRDRFADHSMMVYRGEELVAVLPANIRSDRTVVSHEGLTYGGLVILGSMTLSQTISCFHALLSELRRQEICTLRYKRIPAFYSRRPDDDLGYCLFLLDARLSRRDCSLVISLPNRVPLQKRRNRQAKKAIRASVDQPGLFFLTFLGAGAHSSFKRAIWRASRSHHRGDHRPGASIPRPHQAILGLRSRRNHCRDDYL